MYVIFMFNRLISLTLKFTFVLKLGLLVSTLRELPNIKDNILKIQSIGY
jgi:hypothetical protein